MIDLTDAAPRDSAPPASPDCDEFDAIVVGTGFGGAVTACRLVEAGRKICILERGRRYGPEDFPDFPTKNLFVNDDQVEGPSTSLPLPDFSRLLWSQDHGIYEIRDLGDAVAVQAAGFGGGSLVYANVHLRPPRDLFDRWPAEYRSLDPYFDLAAYMLQVTPVPQRLAKTLQLERAAKKLQQPTPEGKPGDPNILWFQTPLAVNFEDTKKDAYGQERHACDMRGRCWLGCDLQAKNTLDLNYLARAENGDPPPDIRTLAEVTTITRDEGGCFTVTYNDLLHRDAPGTGNGDRRQCKVRARHVFLCAGSVNTTALLMKNAHLWKARGRSVPPALGSHFFPNADSLSVVFDCDEPHEADYGPTITSALLFQAEVKGKFGCSLDFKAGLLTRRHGPTPHAGDTVRGEWSGATAKLSHDPILDWGNWKRDRPAAGTLVLDANPDPPFQAGETLEIRTDAGIQATAAARSASIHHDHWFLLEDGGFPTDLEPMVGIFRSPLWMRRNRYLEFDEEPPAARRAPLRRSASPRFRVKAVASAVGSTVASAAASGGLLRELGAQTRGAKFGPLATTQPPPGQQPGQQLLSIRDVFGENLQTILPPWFVRALQDDRKQLLRQAAAAALPVIGRVLDDLSTDLASQLDPQILDQLGFGKEVDGVRPALLIRGMLRQALQVVAGSEAAIAERAAQEIGAVIPNTLEDLLEMVGNAVLWAMGFRAPEGHTGMILTMGRDLYRGRLFMNQGQLSAQLPGQLLDPSSVMQERVLRTIAKNWHGELRSNPAWAPLGNRITVHSQGGCPMSEDPACGVTTLYGEVHGVDGLYVMDAAAFPTSVGVNPSATIAAVAEFKVEKFLRTLLGDGQWRAKDHVDVSKWMTDDRRSGLDRLNPPKPKNKEPDLEVLDLEFKETMTGFYTEAAQSAPAIDWNDLAKFPELIPLFENAEDEGIERGETIDIKLTARILDLAEFLALGAVGQSEAITITNGMLQLRTLEKDRQLRTLKEDRVESGTLELFIPSPIHRTPPILFMRYKLDLRDGEQTYVLNGLKVLDDQPGFDVWHDTSTLYFEISGAGRRPLRGIMRVPAQDFLTTQFPSMEVTTTNDPARKSWGLTSFYRYFGSQLSTVYIRRQRDLLKFLGNVLTATNV